MFQTVSPLFIPLAVFAGGVLAPVLGWARAYLNSKNARDIVSSQGVGESPPVEKMDWKRVAASAVIAALAAVVFLGQYSGAVSVGLPDIETAFVAGFGADKIVKNAIGL